MALHARWRPKRVTVNDGFYCSWFYLDVTGLLNCSNVNWKLFISLPKKCEKRKNSAKFSIRYIALSPSQKLCETFNALYCTFSITTNLTTWLVFCLIHCQICHIIDAIAGDLIKKRIFKQIIEISLFDKIIRPNEYIFEIQH